MVGYCFVPGCVSGYRKTKVKNKKEGRRNPSLFLPPKDLQLFNLWKKAIPRRDCELRAHDCICDLHFQENDVERYFVTRLRDGTIHALKRSRPRLRPGAVPCIFSDLPKYVCKLGKTIAKVSKSYERPLIMKVPKDNVINQESIKMLKINCQTTDINELSHDNIDVSEPNTIDLINVLHTLNEISDDNICSSVSFEMVSDKLTKSGLPDAFKVISESMINSNLHYDKNYSNMEKRQFVCNTDQPSQYGSTVIKEKRSVNFLNASNVMKVMSTSDCCSDVFVTESDNEKDQICENIDSMDEEENAIFTFEDLKNNLLSIKLPDASWSSVIVNNSVICSKWDTVSYTCDKKIIVDNNLLIKIILKNKILSGKSVDQIKSIQDLSNLLELVESYRV